MERGECQAGIVYKTDALQSKKVKIAGVFPAHTHSPIVYPIALTQQGSKNADAVKFMRFMSQHTEAKKIYQHYGFKL